MSSTLTIRSADLYYGAAQALYGITIECKPGRITAVLGRNGVGKSSTLRAVTGINNVSAGEIVFDNDVLKKAPPYKRARMGIGYVPQGREIFPGLTVYENLRMGCSTQDSAEEDIIAAVLEQFPRLKALLDRTGGALSGGEQQLLAIARCLCGDPRLVLLDEPTEGIQPSIIDEIVETLQRLRARSGLTMILVEQNLDFIAALSQRILIIQKGAITRQVAPGELGDASLVGEFVGIAT